MSFHFFQIIRPKSLKIVNLYADGTIITKCKLFLTVLSFKKGIIYWYPLVTLIFMNKNIKKSDSAEI